MSFKPIELALGYNKIKYDVKGGFGWFVDERQLLQKENVDLAKQLETERLKLSSIEVELRTGAIVVLMLVRTI